MKAKLLLLSLICISIIACNKDEFTTKPQLTFKSVNTQRLVRGTNITFSLGFTDKEGDIEDTIYMIKRTRNCTNSNITARYKVPEFNAGKNASGDFELTLGYNFGNGIPEIQAPQCPGRNDSSFFLFVLKDKAGNRSDTVSSPEVVIIR
jgi:hypothetical protein